MANYQEERIQEKKRKSTKNRPLKKLVTNVVSAITQADKFGQLEFLTHCDLLKIQCTNFDSTYSSILSNYFLKGDTNFELCFKIMDKTELNCLAHAQFTRDGIKLFPGAEVDNLNLQSETFSVLIKPKFVSYAKDGSPKIGEMYSNLRVPVYGVKIKEKHSFTIYNSSENNETPIMNIRGTTNTVKWVAKTIGASFSATDFKVYYSSDGTLVAKITPNTDFNIVDTTDKTANFMTVKYKQLTTNVSDRVAILGAGILICVHRCMKEIHQILESYQKSQV